MSDTLSDESKGALKRMLDEPLMRKALNLVMVDVWQTKAMAPSLEQAAMAYNYYAGAVEAFERLHSLADLKKTQTPVSKRLRPES